MKMLVKRTANFLQVLLKLSSIPLGMTHLMEMLKALMTVDSDSSKALMTFLPDHGGHAFGLFKSLSLIQM